MIKTRLQRFILFSIGTLILFALPVVMAFSNTGMQVEQAAAMPAQQALPNVSFTALNQNAAEDIGVVSVDVTISSVPDPTLPVTLTYRTLNGTATSGQDYTAATGIITFTSTTATTKSFNVAITNDTVSENNETINLVLQSPENANLGTISTATITILDNDPTPTATSGAVVYADGQEPNDTFNDATDIASDAPDLCSLTLWPFGDADFFRFNAKQNATYRVTTSDLSPGLDTFMRVYDPALNVIGTNDDDSTIGSRASSITFVASQDGFYTIEITNLDPSDPTNKTYCIEVDQIQPLTPTPSNTPVPGADDCEFNSTFDTACLVGVGEEVDLSFVPTLGSEQDTDILKMWVLPGVLYTCETFDLSPVTDTNIILYNQNREPFNPWIGNADRAQGDPSSEVSYLATYKGYIYVMIGPENPPPYEESSQHTYSARCTATVATPTSTPAPTVAVPPGGGTGGVPAATATSFAFPTPVPTPTPIDLSFLTPVAPTPPVVEFQPLPTPTAVAGPAQNVTINLTVYYDNNQNFMPELNEGVMDAAVALYDNVTGQLIAFGYTNEAGMVQFSNISTEGAVRVVVPFLNYNQVVVSTTSDILVRVAPQPLPVGIP